MMNRIIGILIISSLLILSGCTDNSQENNKGEERDFKNEMRNFVINISEYSEEIRSNFIIIPQNGHELITENAEEYGPVALNYTNAIDGIGREDLFYGYNGDNIPTRSIDTEYMIAFLDIAESNGVRVLVTDYCWSQENIDDSFKRNEANGYISFAADHRELDDIPSYPVDPYNANDYNISLLNDAKNFLYLLNPGSYDTKERFLNAIENSNYDVVITDLFYSGNDPFTADEVTRLKLKPSGGNRLVIAYMSIGEAEDYRYYWQSDWNSNKPNWLEKENPSWLGNYKVKYWEEDWQEIIYGNNDSYLKKIIDAGFDGVYLDIIDAYEYFEGD